VRQMEANNVKPFTSRTPVTFPPHNIGELLDQMSQTGFQGRKLGEAVSAWKRMLREENLTIFLGLSGAMIPAGMGPYLSFLAKNRAIDVLVSTGANISHDLYCGLGGKHYLGENQTNDERLRNAGIHRIYDVYESQRSMDKTEDWIMGFAEKRLIDDRPYSSREITGLIGKELARDAGGKSTLLACTSVAGIPAFVPALGDSILGSSIMLANDKFDRRIVIDMMKDLDEMASISAASSKAGAVLIGGGVPKNYIQQSAVIASYRSRHDKRFSYGVQLSMDSPQWGGLSGSTFPEAISWGKYKSDARLVTCYVDATIALPLIATTLADWTLLNSRTAPKFSWEGGHLALGAQRSIKTH